MNDATKVLTVVHLRIYVYTSTSLHPYRLGENDSKKEDKVDQLLVKVAQQIEEVGWKLN